MDLSEMQEAVQSAITDIAIYKDKIKVLTEEIKEKYDLKEDGFEDRIEQIDEELKEVRDLKKKAQRKAERILDKLEGRK